MKRKITLILILTLILSVSFVAFSADNTSELKESEYYNDIKEIESLGIMTGDANGNFNPFESLTRAEFAKIICYIDTGALGYEAIGTESPFYDLKPDHWAFSYINYAVKNGMMKGYSDGSFRPDECITVIQAAKVLVSLAGYDYKAVAAGDYPSGYYITAKTLGILNGISVDSEEFINRDEVARLINNALDVSYLSQKGVTEDGAIYSNESNETLLNVKFKMRRIKDRVYATDVSSIGVNSVLSDNMLNVGGTVIYSENIGFRDFLGYYVSCIYSYENDRNELVSIVDNSTEILEINSSDYSSYSENKLFYELNDETYSVNISTNADFILNGDNISYTDGVFDIDLGSITFIRNKNSNSYDLVIIKSYKIFNIYSLDKDKKIISDKFNYSNKLDLSDEDKIYKITDYNGNRLEFEKIKINDILTVCEGNRVVEIYAGALSLDAVIYSVSENEVETDSGILKRNYYSMNNNSLSPGKTYKLILDYFGNITDAEVKSESAEVYYFVKTSETSTPGATALYGKFYTLSDEFISYEFQNNVIIDGKFIKDITELKLFAEISDTAVTSDGICQPVTIEVKDNKILKLNTARKREELINNGEDGLCLRYEEKERKLQKESKSYGWEIYVNDNTPFMVVPPNASITNEDSFKISSFADFDSSTVTLAGYTLSKDNVVTDIVLVKKDAKTIANEFEGHDILAVVDKVSIVKNEDGEFVKRFHILKGTYGGATEMDVYVDKDSTLIDENGYSIHDIVKGDTIKVRWNEDNEIQIFLTYYKSNLPGNKYVYTGKEEGSFTTIAERRVTDIQSGYMFVESLDGEISELFNLEKYTIIVVKTNGTSCIVEKGTADDITLEDYVINHIISRSPKTLIVYK